MTIDAQRPPQAAWRRALTWLASVGMLLAIFAVFVPTSPAFAECKPDGVPAYAGTGISGAIDPQTAKPSGGNYYGEYGWSGLRWNNCDIHKFGDVTDDLVAVIDTWGGNALLGIAAVEGSVMTAMHKWTADPTATLKPIDDKIVQLSTITQTVLFDDWAFPVIIFAAIGILVGALTKQVRTALMTLLCTALALGFVSIVGMFPLAIAQSTDGVASSIVSAADARALEYAGIPTDASGAAKGEHLTTATTEEATGAILNDAMLQPMWRLGQTGSSNWVGSTDAMFKASTASWSEVKDGYKPEDKRDAYNTAVDDVKNDNKTANQYQTIKGQSYNRAGAGFVGALMMTTVGLIRIPAEALMFLGMLVIRFVPLLGPIFALMAIPAVTRGATVGALKIVAASVYNVVVFGVIASIHTAITAILYVNSLNLFVSTLISIIVTFLLLKLSKPFRSVTKLATGAAVSQQLADAPNAPGNAAKALLGMATGTVIGSFAHSKIAQRKNGSKKELAQTDKAHSGPDTKPGEAPALHEGWTKAPPLSPKWADAPQFAPENKWAGLDKTRADWDEPIFVPPTDAAAAHDTRQTAAEVNVLTEPEFHGGNIVTSIFVPEGATEHVVTQQIEPERIEPDQ